MENEGTDESAMKVSFFRPAATATSLTLSVPTSMPSCTNGEFADCSMASRRSISPWSWLPSLVWRHSLLSLSSQILPV